MKNNFFLQKIIESFKALMPITVIIFLTSIIIGIDTTSIINFLFGTLLLIIGLALFQLGSFHSTVTIAEDIGILIVKKRKLGFFIFIAFFVGFLITIAEPALWVLADQFKSVIIDYVMVLVVAVGVGLFVLIALLRILIQFKIRTLFFLGYGLLFFITLLVMNNRPDFIPVAFDSGGVTTGPMAVPFIMALGLGMSRMRGDINSQNDSFGLVGIASIGPIISVLVLGLFFEPTAPVVDLTTSFIEYFLMNIRQMAIAILPFIIFFVAFQIGSFHLSKYQVIKIMIAFFYTYIGLVLFLTGANAGLVNIGFKIGSYFSGETNTLLAIPLGMVFGYSVVSAEPSVIALIRQVEEVSAGTVNRKFMLISLSIGVSIAIGLALLRVITGINILWFLLPGYALAMALTFFSPKTIMSIAFDAGGAVSGAMTSAFLIPYALGVASIIPEANILTDAFGLVGLVAMIPIITIQIFGIILHQKTEKNNKGKQDIETIQRNEVAQ